MAGGCALAAAAAAFVQVTGATDPVGMPLAPQPVPLLGAVSGLLLVATATRTRLAPGARTAVGALCAAALLAGSLPAVPHTVLIAIAWAGSLVSGGTGPFDIVPSWPMTLAHLLAVVAALMLLAWLAGRRRADRGRCAACGRVEPARAGADDPMLPRLAAAAIAGSLPYGLIKTAWGLGWKGGLLGHQFDGVSFTSPGLGDTAVLTGIGIAVALAMGARVSGRWRPVLLGVGGLGSLMLVPVAVAGVISLVPVALGLTAIDNQTVSPWAFTLVYLSFLAWGGSLSWLTVRYHAATRPACSGHRLPAPVPARPGPGG